MSNAESTAQIVLGFAALTAFLVGFSAFRWHDQLDKRSTELDFAVERLNRECMEPDARPYPSELRLISEPKDWQADPVAGFTLLVAALASMLTMFLAAIAWKAEWGLFEMASVLGACLFHVLITTIAVFDYRWINRQRMEIDRRNPGVAFLKIEKSLRVQTGRAVIASVSDQCEVLRHSLPGWCWIDLFEAEALALSGEKNGPLQIDGLERCIALTHKNAANDTEALTAWIWAQALRGKAILVGKSERLRLSHSRDQLALIVNDRLDLTERIDPNQIS